MAQKHKPSGKNRLLVRMTYQTIMNITFVFKHKHKLTWFATCSANDGLGSECCWWK